MSSFTKTIIVDRTASSYPHTIREGVDQLPAQGGVVIVEAGEYEIDGTNSTEDKRSVSIPSNVTLIGRGNVVVKVTQPGTEVNPIHAFTNADQTNGNTNITITGFKIVVACGESGPYNSHLIFFQNVSDCLIEKITIVAPESENYKGDTSREYFQDYLQQLQV
jgi:hypothetical protein